MSERVKNMRIIFCSDPWNSSQPDSMYTDEAKAAEQAGFTLSLINFEALVEQQNIPKALRRIENAPEKEVAIYRGWMLRPEVYTHLYKALIAKNIYLINTPTAYKHCHYLPESYKIIEEHTPRSVWVHMSDEISIEEIMRLLHVFGRKPVIVKDFVKSRKHEWYEACYIPSASDRQAVERVVTRFLQLQDKDVTEGLVFREFIEFEPLTNHSRSNMPLTKEFRLFFFYGLLSFAIPYWEEGDYENTFPPLETFQEIAKQIKSHFFTMDIAKPKDGDWMIIELGDGQVAGLPKPANTTQFYQTLQDISSPLQMNLLNVVRDETNA